MYKIIILLFSFAFVSCSSLIKVKNDDIDSFQWKLIYYNSENGETIKGNIDILINAVKNGQQVRIVFEQESLIFATDAEYLWVLDNVVYAQNNGQVSVGQRGNKLFFQDDSYYWMFLINSNGERDMIRWSVGEHDMVRRNKDKVSIKWFIKN